MLRKIVISLPEVQVLMQARTLEEIAKLGFVQAGVEEMNGGYFKVQYSKVDLGWEFLLEEIEGGKYIFKDALKVREKGGMF